MEHVEDGCRCEGKRCSACKVTLCVGMFPKSSARWRNSYCKSCRSEYNKKYSGDPTHKEKMKDRISKNGQDRAEYQKAYQKKYRARIGRERYREYDKQWHENNREKWSVLRAANHARRKAERALAGGSYTLDEWINLKATYNYTCLCCEKRNQI